jgi:DNA (cytosine-5)-methyltransferase 1
LRSVELFTGAGGLALGIEHAGFRHHTVVERDRNCCNTIRVNQARGCKLVENWNLYSGDVREYNFTTIKEAIHLLAAGPPCQPFSIGGKHGGFNDSRDMFPQVVRAVRELRPAAILVENVKGLRRRSFAKYFQYILQQLSHPEITRLEGETWLDHLQRLEQYHTKGKWRGLEYNVVFRVLNAADYGVPQKRERVFFVGFRSDVEAAWSFPSATHSRESLLFDQWVSGEYWERHKIPKRQRPEPPARLRLQIQRIAAEQGLFSFEPWRTVRDAIADLPDPEFEPGASAAPNHHYNPGARKYAGHTGSPLDEQAKTLKAGDHGVPGGENTVVYPDGRVRYFTVRESARLQTFPDDYIFQGSWSETMRQLGNAVPVRLGYCVANAIAAKLH